MTNQTGAPQRRNTSLCPNVDFRGARSAGQITVQQFGLSPDDVGQGPMEAPTPGAKHFLPQHIERLEALLQQ